MVNRLIQGTVLLIAFCIISSCDKRPAQYILDQNTESMSKHDSLYAANDSAGWYSFDEKLKSKKCFFLYFWTGMNQSEFDIAMKKLAEKEIVSKNGAWCFSTQNFQHFVNLQNNIDVTNSTLENVRFEISTEIASEFNEVVSLYTSKYGYPKSRTKIYSSTLDEINGGIIIGNNTSGENNKYSHPSIKEVDNLGPFAYYTKEDVVFVKDITMVSITQYDYYFLDNERYRDIKRQNPNRYKIHIEYKEVKPEKPAKKIDYEEQEKQKQKNIENTKSHI